MKCSNCNNEGVSVSVKCPTCGDGDGPTLALHDAAPDLLAALKVAKRLIEDATHDRQIIGPMAQIRKAINKATRGE